MNGGEKMDDSFVWKIAMWTILLPFRLVIMLVRFIIRTITHRES